MNINNGDIHMSACCRPCAIHDLTLWPPQGKISVPLLTWKWVWDMPNQVLNTLVCFYHMNSLDLAQSFASCAYVSNPESQTI